MGKFYNLKTIPLGLWGHVLSKGLNIEPFNYDEQNGYLKVLIGEGRGLGALQSFRSLKQGTRTFNFR